MPSAPGASPSLQGGWDGKEKTVLCALVRSVRSGGLPGCASQLPLSSEPRLGKGVLRSESVTAGTPVTNRSVPKAQQALFSIAAKYYAAGFLLASGAAPASACAHLQKKKGGTISALAVKT